MQKQLGQVLDFHKKFHSRVGETPMLIAEDRANHRYEIMLEEVEEYLKGVKEGDLNNVAKECADIMYTLLGTVIEHGLQEDFEAIFDEVHGSNMSKDYGKYKMIKGENYFKADINKILNK